MFLEFRAFCCFQVALEATLSNDQRQKIIDNGLAWDESQMF